MDLSTKISQFNNSIKEFEEGITKEIKELKELLLLTDDETQQPSSITIPQLKHSVDSLSKRLNAFLDESNVNLTSEEMYGILRKAVEEVEQDYEELEEVVVEEEEEEEEEEEDVVHNEFSTPPPAAPPAAAETKIQFNGTPTLESLGLTTASMALLRIKETTSVKTPSKDSILPLHSDDIPSSPQLHTTLKKKKKKKKNHNLLLQTEDNNNNIKRVSYSSSIIIQSPTLKTQTLSESLVKRATTTTSMLFQQEKENIPSSSVLSSTSISNNFNNKNLIREISVEEYNNCLDFSLKSQFSFEFLCGVVSWLNEVLQEKFSVGEEEDDTYYFKKDLYRNFNQNLFNWSDLLEGLDRPAGILLVLMKLKRIERVTTDKGEDKMYRVL